MKRKKMGKIKYVYIEKKKNKFSQQIVAIFLLFDNRMWGDFGRRNYGGTI